MHRGEGVPFQMAKDPGQGQMKGERKMLGGLWAPEFSQGGGSQGRWEEVLSSPRGVSVGDRGGQTLG